MADVARESFVQLARLVRGLRPPLRLLPRAALETSSADFWIRIRHGGDDAADTGLDQGVGAGSGASLMRVRFQIDVQSSAARFWAGLFQGEDLRVLHAA